MLPPRGSLPRGVSLRIVWILVLVVPLAAASAPGLARETLWEGDAEPGSLLTDPFTLARAYDLVEIESNGAIVVVRGPDGLVRHPQQWPLRNAIWEPGEYEIIATLAGGTDLPPAHIRLSGVDSAALEAARVEVRRLDVPAQTSAFYDEDPFDPIPGGYLTRAIDCRGGAASITAWDGDHPLPFTVPMSGAGACVNEAKDLALGYLSVPIELDNDDIRIVIEAYGPPGFVAHYVIRAVPP